WVLAAGSIVAGYLGVPHALGGPVGIPHLFERWLEPVTGPQVLAEAGGAGGELALMAVSVAVAAGGVLLAWLLYVRRRPDPAVFSAALGGVPYRLVLNKWYVDELYQAVFVRGTLALAAL